MPHNRKTQDSNSEVQIPRHAFQQAPLLEVLAPKKCRIWLYNVEQLCHHLRRRQTPVANFQSALFKSLDLRW